MRSTSALVVLFLGLCVPRLHATPFIGVSWGGHVQRFDSAQPGVEYVGPSGFTFLNSLARDGAGNLYTVGALTSGGATDRLIRIDPQTGQGTQVASISLGETTNISAMAFSPAGELYAAHYPGSGSKVLYKINVLNGQATRVGNMGLASISSLAFAPNGKLYAFDVWRGLLDVSLVTGFVADVNGVWDSLAIESLAFGPDGVLYGVCQGGGYGGTPERLYTIDVVTGVPTLLRDEPDLYGVRGIEPVPEPSSLLLLLAGVGCLQSRRRSNS